MTDHYFENELVSLHYYKFGNGPKTMLCFHGYGMHGKQFKLLEGPLGANYTFFGFDLFFHKETKLKDQNLHTIKIPITKKEFATLIGQFCKHENIGRFSVIGYSMGTHYATAITEELGFLVDEYIVAAPSSLNAGKLIRFFSKNRIGNKLLEKITLNKSVLVGLLKSFKHLRMINAEDFKILHGEIGTAELRFNLYASFTYLRLLETDETILLTSLLDNNIKSIFIFGSRDKSFPPHIGDKFIGKLKNKEVIILNEGHEMLKKDFVTKLARLLV